MLTTLLPILFEAPPVDSTVSTTFINLGAVGALCLLLVWFFYRVYNQLHERAKAQEEYLLLRAQTAEEETRTLNREFREKYAPALTNASLALAEAARAIGDVTTFLRNRG